MISEEDLSNETEGSIQEEIVSYSQAVSGVVPLSPVPLETPIKNMSSSDVDYKLPPPPTESLLREFWDNGGTLDLDMEEKEETEPPLPEYPDDYLETLVHQPPPPFEFGKHPSYSITTMDWATEVEKVTLINMFKADLNPTLRKSKGQLHEIGPKDLCRVPDSKGLTTFSDLQRR